MQYLTLNGVLNEQELVKSIIEDVIDNMTKYAHKKNIKVNKEIGNCNDLDQLIEKLSTPLFDECGNDRDREIKIMNKQLKDLNLCLSNMDMAFKK